MAQPLGAQWLGAVPLLARVEPARRVRDLASSSSWVAVLLLALLLIPSEFSYHYDSLRLTPYRLVLLAAFVPCVVRLYGPVTSRVLLPDLLVGGLALWVALALTVNHDGARGLEAGGIFAVESLGAYALARCAARNRGSFLFVARALLIGGVLLFLMLVPEALSGWHLAHTFGEWATGHQQILTITDRFGLTRAYGPFDHPILAGVLCGSLLSLTWYSARPLGVSRSKRSLASLCVMLGAAASVSAGACAVVVLQLGLIAWDRVTRGLARRWLLLAGLCGSAYMIVALVSNRSGIKALVWYLTFNRHTANNRFLVWEHATQDVAANPFFGIGFHEWSRPEWMSGSMDSFWLALTVRHGIPAALAVVGVIAWIGVRLTRADSRAEAALRTGWAIGLVALVLGGFTVHYWNQLLVYCFFFLGLGMWMLEPTGARTARRAAPSYWLPLDRRNSTPAPQGKA